LFVIGFRCLVYFDTGILITNMVDSPLSSSKEGQAGPFRCGGGVPAPPVAILLAAGQSKRMRSHLVKVLHEVAGRPMLAWVIDACKTIGCDPVYVVIGHQGEQVRESFGDDPVVRFVEQKERLGTGHAVAQTEEAMRDVDGDVIVLAGDGPLIRAATIQTLLQAHRDSGADGSLATSVIKNPGGYGRIIRDEKGEFLGIVEEKDATDAQHEVCEINPSYYCFKSPVLFDTLKKISNQNASGEYYLTDVFSILRSEGKRVTIVDAVPAEDVLSINTQEQLTEVSEIMESRLAAVEEAGL